MAKQVSITELHQARVNRSKDQTVRSALGLRRVGVHYKYEDFLAKPMELFVDSSGDQWVKVELCIYRRLNDLHRDITNDYDYLGVK